MLIVLVLLLEIAVRGVTRIGLIRPMGHIGHISPIGPIRSSRTHIG